MRSRPENTRPWSIVLSGGEGERTSEFIRRWQGRHRPKQYCSFHGSRSLFQTTVDRADALSGSDRRLVVAAEGHRSEITTQLRERRRGRVIYQPANRGTAPGIFLPLTYLRELDPEATVIVHPSDHFIHPEWDFLNLVRRAVGALSTFPDAMILLGARPEGPEPDYGWIRPGVATYAANGLRVHPIEAFVEKPDPVLAREVMDAGGLWNTFIIVARAATMWELGRRHLPAMIDQLEPIGAAMGTEGESRVLASAYEAMPERDFSRHLLQAVPERLATIELRGVTWSDWGRPERIVQTLDQIGETPAFPRETVFAA